MQGGRAELEVLNNTKEIDVLPEDAQDLAQHYLRMAMEADCPKTYSQIAIAAALVGLLGEYRYQNWTGEAIETHERP